MENKHYKEKNKNIIKWILIIGAAVVILAYLVSFVVGSETVSAQLNVESGQVLVNDKEVTGDVLLKNNDVIQTGDDGSASVVLYESIVIDLDPNTKISLQDLTKENPQVSQEYGKTWNKFTKIAGVESYSIKTGNTVASVRGTAFGFEEGKVITEEGEVEYSADKKLFRVKAGRAVERINNEFKERDHNIEERALVKIKAARIIEHLKRVRKAEIRKNPRIFQILIKRTGLSKDDLIQKFNELDNGSAEDVDKLFKDVPKVKSVDKIIRTTKAIQEVKRELRSN